MLLNLNETFYSFYVQSCKIKLDFAQLRWGRSEIVDTNIVIPISLNTGFHGTNL